MASEVPPLVVHVIFRLDYGGLENGLVNLLNSMPADRFRHAIVCLAGSSDFRLRLQRKDVAIYDLQKRPGNDPRVYLRLWRLLRELAPAIVHTRNFGTVDLQWVALAAGVKHRVHGEHGWDASDPRGRNRKRLAIRKACRLVVRRYIAMSRDLADWLESAVGVPPERITQIYNGVDAGRFGPDGYLPADLPWGGARTGQEITFGTLGRLDPVKNQQALLNAFARAIAVVPEGRQRLRLIIAGGGALAGALRTQAETLGVADRVWLAGARDDAAALMRAMDVFVLPSLNEGISNTILEAMGAGRPVIAACVGGNGELVQSGITGVLYDPGDEEALTGAMVRYCEQPQLCAVHGAAGRRRVMEEFSLDAMVGHYVDVYQRLIAH